MASQSRESAVTLLSDRCFDPKSGVFAPSTILVENGTFSNFSKASTSPESASNSKTVDLCGLLVLPGLIDFHTHLFHGQDLGVHADILVQQGITAAVDAGSAGAHLFGAFKELVIEQSELTVKSFLNIATVGTTSILLQGELKTPAYCNEEIAFETARSFSKEIIGIKVRASNDVGGDLAVDGFNKARSVASKLGLPLMVHLGPAPAEVDYILDRLGPGDILTHAYTGWQGNTLVDDSKPRPTFVAAKKRGVLFDIGHGMGGFDSSVAQILIDHGYYPDMISSDIHTYSKDVVIGLPEVAAKFVALGMELSDVLVRVTTAPAEFGGFTREKVGTFEVGAQADLAAFKCIEEDYEFSDCHGHKFGGKLRLVPAFTMIRGKILFDPDKRAL